MANTLTFDGFVIKGTHQNILVGSAELNVRRTRHWGSTGETEIVGAAAGRTIEVACWLHDPGFTALQNLLVHLNDLDKLIGRNGTLSERSTDSNPVNARYEYCTLERVEQVAIDGQREAGPVYDSAGTLDGGWTMAVRLHFRQLVLKRL